VTVFVYKALGADGQASRGTLAADSRAAALAALAGRGLHPLEVAEDRGGAARRARAIGRKGRVSARQVESFTRELANLLGAGVPLARSLSLLHREASTPAARFLWGQVHDDVVAGTPLADALAKFPGSFSGVYVAMVRAGEAGGFLEVVLNQIADFRTREQELKGKVKAALVYPCVLAVLATAVLVILLVFFIPRFQTMFASHGASLPALTRAIMAASDGVYRYGLLLPVAALGVVLAGRRLLASASGRRRLERAVLSTPLLKQVVAHFALVRFCRMLGTLVGAGVPLVAALRTAKEAIGSQTLADTVTRAIEEVQRGTSLAKSFALSPILFPAPVIEMVAVAEETGRLDKELVRLAATYELELDRRLRMLVALIEPAMLFLMAATVGTLVIGMLLPIFSLQDLMQ
jgi:type II secretory pathway component PulF